MKSNYDYNTDLTKPPLYKMDPTKQKRIHENIKKVEKEWSYRRRMTKQFTFVIQAFAISSVLLFLISSVFTGKLQDYTTGVLDFVQQQQEKIVLDQVEQKNDFKIQNEVEFEREWMKGTNYAVTTFEGSKFEFYSGVTLNEKTNGALEVVITSPEGEVKTIRYLFEQKSAIKVKTLRDKKMVVLNLAPDGKFRYYDLLTRRVITNN